MTIRSHSFHHRAANPPPIADAHLARRLLTSNLSMWVWRLRVFCVAVVVVLFCSAHNGGCHPDQGQLLPSPVQALALVVELPDGSLHAELTLVSNAVVPSAFVMAVAPRLHGPGGTVSPLAEVSVGRYQLRPEDGRDLHFASGEYLVTFSIDGEQAHEKHVYPGDFILAMHGAMPQPELEVTLVPPGDELAIQWQPASAAALIEVRDQMGELIYSNLSDPVAAALPSWSSLQAGGSSAIDAAELASDADQRLRVCAVEIARSRRNESAQPLHSQGSVDAELGSASGMLVGRCAELEIPTP